MRGLIILVTTLSLLIVVALVLVVYGLVKGPQSEPFAAELPPLILPAGSAIDMMTAIKGDLALHVKTKAGEYIYLVDPHKGTIHTRLPIKRKK